MQLLFKVGLFIGYLSVFIILVKLAHYVFFKKDDHYQLPYEWRPYSAEDEIKKLVEEGHTGPCAWRQLWGDGVCECLVKYPRKLMGVNNGTNVNNES